MSISATVSSFVAKQTRSASPLPPSTNSLRILIVDDNHINLSILSTLLKRRFSHALARPPVSIDSGLKALQLLRTEIFDLVFMDIEMPYLDGVECTRRIRAGEDGILAANRNAHVVAVTTNVGPEPASLYRHVGMDGMIGKPVRFENFQQYLCPLSIEASAARGSVTPVLVGEEQVMPPLPPIELEQRLFFVPTSDGGMATSPRSSQCESSPPPADYSDANQFAAMLKAQTSKSLRDRKALSVSRSTTLSEPRRSSFNSPRSEHLPTITQSHVAPVAVASATIQMNTLCNTQSCHADNDKALSNSPLLSFQGLVERETRERELDHMMQRRNAVPVRPVPIHRISSPAYLLDASPIGRLRTEPAMRSNPDLAPHAVRPSIRPVAPTRYRRNDSEDSEDNATDSGDNYEHTASSSSNWSSTPMSSQRSASLDMLSTFSSHRPTSPSSELTTPVSSPADMDIYDDVKAVHDEDSQRAPFSPCADDLLGSRGSGLSYLDSPMLPAFPPLSKQAHSSESSPRIRVCSPINHATPRHLGSRIDELHL